VPNCAPLLRTRRRRCPTQNTEKFPPPHAVPQAKGDGIVNVQILLVNGLASFTPPDLPGFNVLAPEPSLSVTSPGFAHQMLDAYYVDLELDTHHPI
jgi:hypothetical protein